jgi:hypothetical protein
LKSINIILFLFLFLFTGCSFYNKGLDNNFFLNDSNKIALVFPSKVVGKYGQDTINTMISYMIHNSFNFELEVFDSKSQELDDIKETFDNINKKKFTNIIILYTVDALKNLFKIENLDKFTIYFPLINKKNSNYYSSKIFYGGLDYKNQIHRLLNIDNNNNSIVYTNNQLTLKLNNYIKNSNKPINTISKFDTNSISISKNFSNKRFDNTSLFLNTSIIDTSMILSQLRIYDRQVNKTLSTQLNYTPLLLSLTQYLDRKNLLIANSIDPIDSKLQETLSILGLDVQYNWVNYSTLIGIDFLFNKYDTKLFPSKIQYNQVEYPVYIYKTNRYKFKKVE